MASDTRPLYERRRSCELRIAELEEALSAARRRHAEILHEEQQADTVRVPYAQPENDIEVDVEFAEWVGEALQL